MYFHRELRNDVIKFNLNIVIIFNYKYNVFENSIIIKKIDEKIKKNLIIIKKIEIKNSSDI